MRFFAYAKKQGPVNFFHVHDETGSGATTLHPTHPPIGEAETRAAITEIAQAWLALDPSDSVYIVDGSRCYLETLTHPRYQEALREFDKRLSRQATSHFIAWVLVFYSVVCFLSTLTWGFGWYGFAIFAGVTLLYLLIVGFKVQNEIEALVVCTILLVQSLFVVGLIPKLQEAAKRHEAKQQLERERNH